MGIGNECPFTQVQSEVSFPLKLVYKIFNWPAGAPNGRELKGYLSTDSQKILCPRGLLGRRRHLIYRDFVPNPTQGYEVPLRIPTLVAARPRLILRGLEA